MKFLRLKKLPEYQIEAPGEVADKIDGGTSVLPMANSVVSA